MFCVVLALPLSPAVGCFWTAVLGVHHPQTRPLSVGVQGRERPLFRRQLLRVKGVVMEDRRQMQGYAEYNLENLRIQADHFTNLLMKISLPRLHFFWLQ